MKIIAHILRFVGRLVPNAKYIKAIPNRILWPLHKIFGLSGGIADTLGFKMKLDPGECVDRNLWFSPHLYDKGEISYISKRFHGHKRANFLDVGANIGFWSLVFASRHKDWSICSVEANPQTCEILSENIKANNFKNIVIKNRAAAPASGKMRLYRNVTGNRGGDSCVFRAERPSIEIDSIPLGDLIRELAWDRVDIMKIDIEGFEIEVLTHFFETESRTIWPECICAETSHIGDLPTLLQSNGYEMAKKYRENAIFILRGSRI